MFKRLIEKKVRSFFEQEIKSNKFSSFVNQIVEEEFKNLEHKSLESYVDKQVSLHVTSQQTVDFKKLLSLNDRVSSLEGTMFYVHKELGRIARWKEDLFKFCREILK